VVSVKIAAIEDGLDRATIRLGIYTLIANILQMRLFKFWILKFIGENFY